ncbi:hypothetical protein N0V93_006931 [Gnomoniopsis smithogilvyi]|uniref:Methyltransferase type 11 domain-containing protein n=1 Tax=Gnomoniopsis smithogilvyi TaxID=1191159 RepID=A0A9W9CUX1_9PEZI|nr:hypothetical protein N0V93_006931 [Gnomoniopsis smithogilvyi]
MASARANVRRHELPGEAAQSKRSGGVMETSSEDFPSSLSRRARKAAESARAAAAAEHPPPRTSSRIPHTSSRPDPPQSYAWKQTLASRARAGNSNASDASGKASASSIGASSIPSSRSQDGSNQPRPFLRRKSPAVTQNTAAQQQRPRNVSARSDSSSSVPQSQASWDMTDRTLTDSPASIRLAQRVEIPSSSHAVTIYPELDRYRDYKPQAPANTQHFDLPFLSTNLPPPTPLFSTTSSQHSAFSGSPSTRYSESPGPGPYSRDTTPTSVSSVSPGLSAPMRLPVSRSKPNSPARPPVTQSVTRRRAESTSHEAYEPSSDHESLAAVRESSNSSSSGSTVRATGDREHGRRKGVSSIISMAPPRKSSEKFSSSRESLDIPSRTNSRSGRESINEAATRIAAPPRRPSRDGTSDLHSQVGLPVPIVHSNLSSTSLSERRRSAQNAPATISRKTTPLQTDPSKQSVAPRVGREPTPAPHAAGTVPAPQAAKPTSRGPTRTPSPSIASTFKSRFPLFGRRNKTAPAAPSAGAEATEKPPRKGPAAGTGHEGYGRLGHVRRRSSNLAGVLRAIPGTMSSQSQSQESLASNQPSDPFLAARMSPVVIAGGEIIHNRNVSSDLPRADSNQSMALPRPSIGASRNNSEVSMSSQEARTTLWPSALPRGETPKPAAGHRRMPSDSSDSDVLTMKSTLAYRRSIQRLKAPDQEKARLPKPITVPQGAITPSIDSRDTTLFSDDSTFSSRRPPMQLRTDSDKSTAKKLKKQPKSPRKWNIFGRTTTSKKKQPEEPQVSAAVKVVQKQPMAFYTMIDNPEQEADEVADVKEVLREARPSRPASPTTTTTRLREQSEQRPSISESQARGVRDMAATVKQPEAKRTLKTVTTVPASRDLRGAAAPPSRPTQTLSSSKAPNSRPSRLPQVGRIPKIATRIDTRVDPPLPSPMSFSRPFNRVSLQLPSPTVTQTPADEFIAKGPSPPEFSVADTELLSEAPKPAAHEDIRSDASPRRSWAKSPDVVDPPREFITFPSRKVSDAPSSTDSSCSGMMSYSEATAVIPDPNAPLAEDEVWDEYNDLLGDGDVPRGHPSTTSSLGKPFHLEMWGKQLSGRTAQPLETPIVPGNMGAQMNAHIDAADSECETEFEAESQVEIEGEIEGKIAHHVDPAPTTSSVYSSGMTAKINEVLEAAGASPFSVHGGAGENPSRNSTELSVCQSRRFSTASSQKARVLRDSQASSSSRGSEDTSAMAQVNLRVGSMTVSKWLTFGHVLFSPVRDELVPMVGSLKRHSILVIDGLGNDDWSFYAAETYPAATFFNLSPRAPLSTDKHSSGHSSFPLSPPNHHQIQYKSHADKLPFGTQSFTCVVYRFPTAAPESHYRNVINEARRVLKPGGYIELSILDVDMNNMGNNARRAVRRLKERMHTRAPNTSLASSSDLILRLLGRKGFSDIKTCRVGVPLATTAPGASSSSASSKTGTTASSTTRKRSKRETRSLADMMCAEGPGADESITKMVAKVGRWWYDRCYESVALTGGEKSMWQDHAILAECEEWRTSLKLMVCHARIPDGRSRVASI